MRIRVATAKDLDFVAAANSALATESESQNLDQALLRPGIQAVLDDPSLGRYYLAEIDGKFVGQLMTTYEWSDWRNGLFLWIQSVYVLPGCVMETVYRGPESHEESQPC
jgi:hypothetical protein